ncbi:uncharacterized protein LOC123005190 [Tribolium madens]|uniref:uncharacterized protein LOC123005190 n=1 Tax=Tribolium madens TaxID=41895 RepID=UPI001CF73B2C|nr:uncharacterized protein LOC123005190 [Tribolium madens]
MFVTGLFSITARNVTVSQSSSHHVSDSNEMIDYKSTSSDPLIERVSSANLDGPISLTWLWEIIVRTKRLPDDLDPKVPFIVLRDRLRNPEREVRQHALRVLADLIPVIDQNLLDKHLEFLLPDLIINLSHLAPAVRKSTIDVLKIYLKHSPYPNEALKKLMTAVAEDSHLKQGLLMAVPYFSNYQISEDTLIFLIRQLFAATNQDFLKETSICSLIKTRSRLGTERFNNLIGDKLNEFLELCNQQNIHLKTIEPNVILETEITLETGPAITMKIHEEEEEENSSSNEIVRHTESDLEMVTRSPRKVHFGGEVVKMRTPESDSTQQSSDDNDIHTSVIIDRPTSIKITVSDNIAAIKTRHKSMIPVRITTGSNPATPRKKIKARRLYKSAPDLGRNSKIPLPFNGSSKKKNKDKENEEKFRRHSRGEDEFSPIPIHEEIEVFHNLTRSPQRPNTESDSNTFTSFQICQDKENQDSSNLSTWEIILRDLSHKDVWIKSRALDDLNQLLRKNTPITITSQLFESLFSCEKQPRLQSRAQETLILTINRITPQTITETYPQLVNDSIRVSPPPGVRLSLLLMQRTSPRKFFETLKVEPKDREAALQALIAATRTFPSSEIDMNRGISMAFDAMKDSKRAVRQAALEALASLAQVAGNTMILDAVHDMSKDLDDSEHILTIVRMRLSRRQLPTVDLNGSVRYSSPREEEELEWLCGGGPHLTKTSSLNSIKVSNYWKHNLRHEIEEVNDNSKTENGILCPVYVLRDTSQVNGRHYRNYDRGRSNSPPSRQDSFSDSSGKNQGKRFFRQSDHQFRKSFSSEQIYNGSYNNSMSSSRSSTTSTVSSRSGLWLKDFRSGIPVPISSDTKLKFRTHRHSSDSFNGPLVAQEPIKNRTKLETTQLTPIRLNSTHSFTQQIPPPSSGSESSGYFTPPAEHHLKEEEGEEENNNLQEPNFQIVESENSEVHEVEDIRQSSASSAEIREVSYDEVDRHEIKRFNSLEDVDFTENRHFSEPRSKSRTEPSIKSSLPEISERKNNSAPPLELPLVPYKSPEVTPIKSQLPGSVASNETTPKKLSGQSPRRLTRRNTSLKRTGKSPKTPAISRPKEILNQALAQMESCDWETVIQGLNSLTRLSHTTPEALEPQMHQICMTLAKNIKNLRSQVSRSACHASSELFNSCKKGLEMELEELATPLLHRTADTNKFLRSDANAALDAMALNMSVPRVVAVIANKGSTHQNGVVRGAATRLMSDLAMRLGSDKIFQLPKETRDKFFLVGANGLTEGSLETRKHAKALMSALVGHGMFHKVLVEAVPQHTLRHIAKTIAGLK